MSDAFKLNINAPLTQAASRGRIMGNWGTRSSGPNEEVNQDLRTLVSRSRTLRRDNQWIGRAITVGTANEVGTGIKPSPDTGDKDFNVALKALWVDYTKHADYQGNLTAYGLVAAMVMGRKEAGECYLLVRRNRVDRSSDSPVPLEFQLVESDQIATELRSVKYNNNIIRYGIETTKNGKVMAYWFHKSHPDEDDIKLSGATTDLSTYVRVPKRDVIQHFKPDRPSQLRGRPETVRAIIRAKNYEDYTDGELVRKKTRAYYTGVIEVDDPTPEEREIDPVTGRPFEYNTDESAALDLSPGTFPLMNPNEKLKLFDSDQTGQGFSDYQRWQLLAISAATNIPYQLISNDWSSINDRIWRGIFNAYKREIQQMQELYIVPQVCDRMWIEFVKRAIVSGAIKLPAGMTVNTACRAQHRPQAFEFINPQQDIASKIQTMQAGLTSRSTVIDEISGGDESSLSVDAQRAIDLAREAELGLHSLATYSTLPSAIETDDSDDDDDDDNDDNKEDK